MQKAPGLEKDKCGPECSRCLAEGASDLCCLALLCLYGNALTDGRGSALASCGVSPRVISTMLCSGEQHLLTITNIVCE